MKKPILFFAFIWISSLVLSQSSTLTICWDTSYSMQERDLDKELHFLDSIISKGSIDRVQLLLFSNAVEEHLIRLDPSEDKEQLFFEFTAN